MILLCSPTKAHSQFLQTFPCKIHRFMVRFLQLLTKCGGVKTRWSTPDGFGRNRFDQLSVGQTKLNRNSCVLFWSNKLSDCRLIGCWMWQMMLNDHDGRSTTLTTISTITNITTMVWCGSANYTDHQSALGIYLIHQWSITPLALCLWGWLFPAVNKQIPLTISHCNNAVKSTKKQGGKKLSVETDYECQFWVCKS